MSIFLKHSPLVMYLPSLSLTHDMTSIFRKRRFRKFAMVIQQLPALNGNDVTNTDMDASPTSHRIHVYIMYPAHKAAYLQNSEQMKVNSVYVC